MIVTDPSSLPDVGGFWNFFKRHVTIEGYLVATRPPRP